MVSYFSIIAFGFFLGMRHATDPDHVIAVVTIVTRQRGIAHSALIGAFWGIGHTLTILMVGTAIILFNLVVPPRLGLSMELCVGLTLIVLGVANIVAFLRSKPQRSEQQGAFEHDDRKHSHEHRAVLDSHSPAPGKPFSYMDRIAGRVRLYQYVRPLIVGILHGLAGSAAVALLILATIRDPHWAIAYLLIFGVGTVAGMMLITMSIASTFSFIGRSHRFSHGLTVASGVLSLVFGLAITYQIGFINGLFTGHASWIPH